MNESMLEEKIDDLIVRMNRLEMLCLVLDNRQEEHVEETRRGLQEIKASATLIEVQVRANQVEIAKINAQAKLVGGVVGIVAGGMSGILSSLFGR